MKQDSTLNDKHKIVDSITELMLDKFIICLCDGDLSVLGEGTEEELKAAWQKIYDEYSDALTTKEQRGTRRESIDVMILQQRVFAIEACVFRLSIQHSEEIVTELRKWITVKEKFDTSNPEQYQRDLQAIINRCKSRYEIDLRQRLTELEQRLPQTEQKIDKWYFEKMIVQLQKTFGQINKFKTTVANFVFMMADLLARGEEMDRQLSKA
jgi:exonuclease VII large subunit